MCHHYNMKMLYSGCQNIRLHRPCWAMLWHALPCHAVLCCTVPYHVMLCHTMPCCAIPCRAVTCHAVPGCATPCCAIPCRAMLYHAVLSQAVPCRPVPCHVMLCHVDAPVVTWEDDICPACLQGCWATPVSDFIKHKMIWNTRVYFY